MAVLSKEENLNSTKLVDVTPGEDVALGISSDPRDQLILIRSLTNLYSDPLPALVREAVSNGLDATSGMPEDERKISLNYDSVDEQISISDNGVGMSLEEIEKYFFNYGASSKREDFTGIGSKGLGAKTPLAYTDQFFVKSVKNGEKTIARLAATEKGFTRRVLQHKTGVKDPNGTTISLVVKYEDKDRVDSILNMYKNSGYNSIIEINGEKCQPKSDNLLGEIATEYNDTDGNPISLKVWGLLNGPNSPYVLNSYLPLMNDMVEVANMEPNSYSSYYYDRKLASIRGSIAFVIGEYIYTSSGYQKPSLVVELKPGMVDFTTSRDSIVNNDRYENLLNSISLSMSSAPRDSEFKKNFVKKIVAHNGKSAASIADYLLRAKTNSIETINSWFDLSSNDKLNEALKIAEDIHKTNTLDVDKDVVLSYNRRLYTTYDPYVWQHTGNKYFIDLSHKSSDEADALINKFRRNRKGIIEGQTDDYDLNNVEFLISKDKNGTIPRIRDFFELFDEVKELDIEKELDDLKKRRAEQRKANKGQRAQVDVTKHLSESFTAEFAEDEDGIISYTVNKSSVVTTDDLVNADYILVGFGSIVKMLNGLYKDKKPDLSSKVVCIPKLSYTVFKAIPDKSRIYWRDTQSSVKVNDYLSNEGAERRVQDSVYNGTELRNLNFTDYCKDLVLRESLFYSGFYYSQLNILTFLKKYLAESEFEKLVDSLDLLKEVKDAISHPSKEYLSDLGTVKVVLDNGDDWVIPEGISVDDLKKAGSQIKLVSAVDTELSNLMQVSTSFDQSDHEFLEKFSEFVKSMFISKMDQLRNQ